MLQARENQRREEQERLEREAAEAERKRLEEEEAHEIAAREAAEKEAALARMRQEKALLLGAEPEKGPNVTQLIPRALELKFSLVIFLYLLNVLIFQITTIICLHVQLRV